MAIRQDSSGRLQPIRFGDMAQPGTCMLCNRIGHTNDELFATFNVELEFYGIIYLCQECCAEVASFVCFIDPNTYLDLQGKYMELVNTYVSTRKQLDEAKGLLNARIDSAGSDEFNVDDFISGVVSKTK